MSMFDPLASGFEDSTPPWPTTPHSPNQHIPNLRKASPAPPPLDDGPAPGLYGKEPQIYGQQEPGLVSPKDSVASNGRRFEKPEPYLRIRITGMDRNRRDILVKLDAQTNLSNFNGTTYRNISRSYFEFQQFYEAIIQNTPQTIIPALPLPQTSAATDEEDDRLVRVMLQRWLTRICEDPILLHDEEVRSFVESDFGYQPTPVIRRKASTGFSLIKRGVPDEDETLQRARFELTKLEGQFFDAARALDKLSRVRKAYGTSHAEMGNKLVNVATTESHPPLGNTIRKIGRVWHTMADIDQAESIGECVILGDSLGYQGLNARSAKETLQQRTAVLEEYQAAVKTAISKRRNIERLKASSSIRPEKVDEALEDLEEANKYEQILAKRADGISQNLHRALERHKRMVHDDITAALVEHVRSSIMYERQLLKELEALRPDISGAADKVVPQPNGIPKPTVILPLEEPPALKPAPPSAKTTPNSPPLTTPSFSTSRIPDASPAISGPRPGLPPLQQPSPEIVRSMTSPQPTSPQRPSQISPPVKSNGDPLLGSRFVDGTKSMFVRPSPQFHTPSAITSSTSASVLSAPTPAPPPPAPKVLPPSMVVQQEVQKNIDPLSNSGKVVARASSTPALEPPMRPEPVGPMGPLGPLGPLGPTPTHGNGPMMTQSFIVQPTPKQNDGLDPLGMAKPTSMTASMRMPQRPRLDPREAASKLANMF